MTINYHTALLYITAILCAANVFYALRRRESPGALSFAGLFLAMGTWAFAYALELNSLHATEQIFWFKFKYFGILGLPIAWLLFAFQYSGRYSAKTRRKLFIIAIFPLASLGLIWTNQLHGLFWRQIYQEPVGAGFMLSLKYGPVFWIHVIYSYLLILYSAWLLVQGLSNRYTQVRAGAIAILTGLVVPLTANIISIWPIYPGPRIDFTPYAFVVTSLTALWITTKLHLLEIIPLAHHTIIDNMVDGLLIVDFKDRIIYVNQATEAILAKDAAQILGQRINQVIDSWSAMAPSWEQEAIHPARASSILGASLDHSGSPRHYEIHIAPLQEPDGFFSGYMVMLRDVSKLKQAEQVLRRQLDEMTVLHAVAMACVEAAHEDTLIEDVTRIIGNSLYPDNFGIMLLDPEAKLLRHHATYREKMNIQSTSIPLGEGITGRVALEENAWYVPDVTQEPAYIETDPHTKSELCVPLKAGGRVIGVINVESAQLEAFNQADERLLSIISGQVSTAIERSRAEADIYQRVQELQAITQVSGEINSVLDRQQLLESIARHAAEISACDACGIFTYQPSGRLSLAAAYGVGDEFTNLLRSQGVPMQGTAVGRAFTTRKPCQVPDIHQEGAEYSTTEVADMEGICSVLAIPMQLADEVIGGIVLWHRQPRYFSREEERFLQALASQSVNALENARLFEQERQQRRLAEVLRETGTALSASLDFETVFDRLLEQLERLVPYEAANVMTIEDTYARVARLHGYEIFGEAYLEMAQDLRLEIDSTPNLRRMIQSRKPMVIPDVRSQADWINLIENSPLRSWAGAPILIEDRVVACFGLDSRSPDYFQPEHIKPLEIFASQAGLALQNARLFEETQRRLSEVTLLRKIIQSTTTLEEPETALNQACQDISHYFNSQQVILALGQPERDHMTVIAEYLSANHPSLVGVSIPASNNPVMAFLRDNKTPLAVHEVEASPLLETVRRSFCFRDSQSTLFVPLFSQAHISGVLGIGTLGTRLFRPEEIELTQNITRQISQALERLQLYTEARVHARRMADLAALSEELNRPMSVDEVLQGIGRGAMSLGETSQAAIYFDGADGRLRCPWFDGLAASYVQAVTEDHQPVPEGQQMLRNEAILIPDLREQPEHARLYRLAEEQGYRSLGLFPLIYQGNVIALIGLYYQQPRSWPKTQQEIMMAFTRQAAIALQNARLFSETRRRAQQQEALNAIIAAGVAAPDLDYLLNSVLDLSLHALDMSQGAIWVKNYHAIRGFPGDIGLASRRISQGQQQNTPQTIVLNNLQQQLPGEHSQVWIEHLEKHNVQALLTVPVMSGGERIGAMSIASPVPKTWPEEEIALAQAVGRQVGSAAERLELVARSQEQARQIQQIIDTVPEGVLVLDHRRWITLANPAAQSYLASLCAEHRPQAPLTELCGTSIEELLAAQQEKPWRELKTESTPARIFEIAVRSLETIAHGEGWVLVMRDVTLEREEQARAQIRDRLATVGQLAAGIAHDFNNIMAAILVYADLLSMEPDLSFEGRQRLKTIQQQIERASELIRQILDFSRRSVLDRSPFDLLPFVRELDKLLGRVLPENIHRDFEYEPGAYMVHADPTHLQQVFMNLALNARDAMPSGGTLYLSLKHISLSPVDPPPVPELSPGRWIKITIGDTGMGIPADVLPHIFDPFFTTKPVGKGTGLGLAQVYGIIHQHGGVIDVESSTSSGTVFSIYLPELETPAELEITTLPQNLQKGTGETLLLVEDDRPARQALGELLESQGYHILVAKNGLEAMQIFKEYASRVDMIISDVVMPEMGGIELYHALTKDQPEIKFLLMTGHPLDLQDKIPLEERRIRRLNKPFSVYELLATLQTMLETPAA